MSSSSSDSAPRQPRRSPTDPGYLESLRRAAGARHPRARGHGHGGVGTPRSQRREAQAVAEGALLGCVHLPPLSGRLAARSQTRRRASGPAHSEARDKEVKARVDEARTVTAAVHLTRDLVNTPPSDLHPVEFAEIAVGSAASCSRSTSTWRSWTRPRWPPADTAASSASDKARPTRRAWSASPIARARPTSIWPSWGRASPSIPAASRSSSPPQWSG